MCVFGGGGGCTRTSACMSACSCMCVCVCACLCELVYHSLPMRATVVGHPLIPSLSCTHTHTHELSLSSHTHMLSRSRPHCPLQSACLSLSHTHTHTETLSPSLSPPPPPSSPSPTPLLSSSLKTSAASTVLFSEEADRAVYSLHPPRPPPYSHLPHQPMNSRHYYPRRFFLLQRQILIRHSHKT